MPKSQPAIPTRERLRPSRWTTTVSISLLVTSNTGYLLAPTQRVVRADADSSLVPGGFAERRTTMKRSLVAFVILILALTSMCILSDPTQASLSTPPSAPRVDPLLIRFLNARVSAQLPVVVTYNEMPGALEFAR